MNIEELNTLANNVYDNGHALLSPSSAGIWKECSGYVVGLEDSRKHDSDKDFSVNGTTAHFYLEYLATGIMPYSDIESWLDRIDANPETASDVKLLAYDNAEYLMYDDAPNEIKGIITRLWLDYIKPYVNNGYTLWAEYRTSLRWLFGHDQCDGSVDIMLYKDGHLLICDLKYGDGWYVSVKGNRQLSLYNLGVFNQFSYITKITHVIMQPRIENRYWDAVYVTLDELNKIGNELKEASIRALRVLHDPTYAEYHPSEHACQWCHKKGKCRAQQDMALSMITKAFATDTDLTPIEIKGHLKNFPFIRAWMKSVEEAGDALVRKGYDVGLKLVKGRTMRKYKVADDQVIPKLIELGVPEDVAIVSKPISIAQLEKTSVPSDVIKAVSKELVIKKEGQPVVALASDHRKEYNPFA